MGKHPAQVAIQEALTSARARFEGMRGQLSYQQEALFAWGHIKASYRPGLRPRDFSLVNCDPQTVGSALVQVATIGLSLNPILKLAYLVPRMNKQRRVMECCLDISYQGLVQLAIESGVVDHVVAERVFQEDIDSGAFRYRGPLEVPVHEGNPFSAKRGESVGVYCVARLQSGGVITSHMSKAELDKIASLSHGRVWQDFRGEMEKKACIKRAYKSWPKPRHDSRMAVAVDYLNTIQGLTLDNDGQGASSEAPDQRPLTHMERMINDVRAQRRAAVPVRAENPEPAAAPAPVSAPVPAANAAQAAAALPA